MILCLDLETTGLDEHTCGLVEIGACWLHTADDPDEAEFFMECRPWEGCAIEAKALEVNGWTRERCVDYALPAEAVAVVRLLSFVGAQLGVKETVQIAAWNAQFDHRHLMRAIHRATHGWGVRPKPVFAHRLLDLHSLVAGDLLRRQMPGLSVDGREPSPALLQSFGGEVKNADQASELLGLTPEPKPHHALRGARQVRAMLLRYLGLTSAVA